MIRLRRLAAVLLAGAQLFQATALGAGIACAADGDVRATPSVEARAEADEHAVHAGHRTTGVAPAPSTAHEHGAGDRMPVECVSMSACAAAAIAAAPSLAPPGALAPATSVAARDDRRPASFGGAPDTPPPRV